MRSLAWRQVSRRAATEFDDVMYVGDVARGITLSLFAAPELEPMYNIATGYGTTPRQFAEAVRAVIPDAEINVGPGMDYLGMGINYYSISESASPNVTLVMSLHTGSGRALKTTLLPLGASGCGRSSHVRPTAGTASATAAVTPAPAVVQGRLAD